MLILYYHWWDTGNSDKNISNNHENKRCIATKAGTVASRFFEKEQTTLHYGQMIQGHTKMIVPKDHVGPSSNSPFSRKKEEISIF